MKILWLLFFLTFQLTPAYAVELNTFLTKIKNQHSIDDQLRIVGELSAKVAEELKYHQINKHLPEKELASYFELHTFLPMIDPDKIINRKCEDLIENIKFQALGHGKAKELSGEVVFVIDVVKDICKNAVKQDDQSAWEPVYSDRGITIFQRQEVMSSDYKIVQGNNEFLLDSMDRAQFNQEKIDKNSSLLRIDYSGGFGTGIAIYRCFFIYVNKPDPILMADILSGGYTANPTNNPIVHQAGIDALSVDNGKLLISYSYGIEGQDQKEYLHSIPMAKVLPEQDECEYIIKAIYGEVPK